MIAEGRTGLDEVRAAAYAPAGLTDKRTKPGRALERTVPGLFRCGKPEVNDVPSFRPFVAYIKLRVSARKWYHVSSNACSTPSNRVQTIESATLRSHHQFGLFLLLWASSLSLSSPPEIRSAFRPVNCSNRWTITSQ